MAAPAAALLAIVNMQQNNPQGRPTRGNNVQAGASGNSNNTSDKKNIMPQKYLTDCRSFYSCLYCRAHLANHDELISRSFQGNRSRAYLFNSVINITTGAPVQRELNTGSHAVADIFCSNCATTVGWKYEKAYVDSQKYKEGKFIIELAHVVRENRHLELDKRDMFLALHLGPTAAGATQAQPSMLTHSCPQPDDSLRPIGQHRLHQGSLSPISSNSAESRWSSSASSAWSQQGDDQAAPRHSELTMFEELGENENNQEDDEEQEVLMFPFHDDLYGERASYSNLSISRLSCRRRSNQRRSLHLDSTPYDWKHSTRPTASLNIAQSHCSPSGQPGQASESTASSSSSPTDQQKQQRTETSHQQPESSLQSPPGPASNISNTSNATRQARSEPVSSDYDDNDVNHYNQHDENEIQFKLEPCDLAGGTRSSDNRNCDQSPPQQANKRTRLDVSRQSSSSSEWDCQPGPSGLGRASETLEPTDSQVTSSSASDCSPAGGCLSVDDEEFYDCDTGEHQVSNS